MQAIKRYPSPSAKQCSHFYPVPWRRHIPSKTRMGQELCTDKLSLRRVNSEMSDPPSFPSHPFSNRNPCDFFPLSTPFTLLKIDPRQAFPSPEKARMFFLQLYNVIIMDARSSPLLSCYVLYLQIISAVCPSLAPCPRSPIFILLKLVIKLETGDVTPFFPSPSPPSSRWFSTES
jgi:hypothetical protein